MKLGPEHPDTMVSMLDISCIAYREHGEPKHGHPLLEETLNGKEKRSPDLINPRHALRHGQPRIVASGVRKPSTRRRSPSPRGAS